MSRHNSFWHKHFARDWLFRTSGFMRAIGPTVITIARVFATIGCIFTAKVWDVAAKDFGFVEKSHGIATIHFDSGVIGNDIATTVLVFAAKAQDVTTMERTLLQSRSRLRQSASPLP